MKRLKILALSLLELLKHINTFYCNIHVNINIIFSYYVILKLQIASISNIGYNDLYFSCINVIFQNIHKTHPTMELQMVSYMS